METPDAPLPPMDAEFERRLVAYVNAWHREILHVLPANASDKAAALWRWHCEHPHRKGEGE